MTVSPLSLDSANPVALAATPFPEPDWIIDALPGKLVTPSNPGRGAAGGYFQCAWIVARKETAA